ncbi:hypothetical protein T440DRAFT_158573 [Plenodomus tracheiphilus IPT5]|uniref:Secreted protein n=1 Tax=Plenodomus tracheiphilus IPT5 TaxID=1408161 RepID=A0A6A7BLC3_9PLEO|nr:hypothetical protein T440DRAFT_158573 [Plenodomus tracheiphilus IPT5]
MAVVILMFIFLLRREISLLLWNGETTTLAYTTERYIVARHRFNSGRPMKQARKWKSKVGGVEGRHRYVARKAQESEHGRRKGKPTICLSLGKDLDRNRVARLLLLI